MSQSAPPGVYQFQPNTLNKTGQDGPGGPQPVSIAPLTAEIHYGNQALTDGSGGVGPYQIDNAQTPTLANRVTFDIYNAGTHNFEVDTNSQFAYGTTGTVVVPGARYTALVGPANVPGGIKHYALCTAGQTCDYRVSEGGQ